MSGPGRKPTSPSAVGIELRHLRYFLAVSEELHFGRAAERLHIAQPPLSQAIRKLEEALGIVLFERTSRSVALTEAGGVFTEEARKVLAAFSRAVDEAQRAGGADAVLRIGCVPHLPIERLLRFLGALREAEPESSTQVAHAFALEQVRLLQASKLELGIFDAAENHPEIETEPLFAGERLAVYLPPEHPLAEKDVVTPDDVRSEVLITMGRELNPALYDRVAPSIHAAGYRFRDIREIDGTTARDLTLAVANGPGIAFAPLSFWELSEAGSIVARRELAEPVAMPDTVVAWRANPPAQLAATLARVREIARALRQ